MQTVMYGVAPWPNNPRPGTPFPSDPNSFEPVIHPTVTVTSGSPGPTREEFASAIESLRAAVRDLEHETVSRLDAIGVHGVGVILAQRLVERLEADNKRLRARVNRLLKKRKAK